MQIKDIQHKAAEAYGQSTLRVNEAHKAPRVQQETEAKRVEEKSENSQRQNEMKLEAARSVLEPVERFAENVGVDLKFHLNAETGQVQAEVRDASGQKVLRKVPADEVVRLAASIKELSHSFFDREL